MVLLSAMKSRIFTDLISRRCPDHWPTASRDPVMITLMQLTDKHWSAQLGSDMDWTLGGQTLVNSDMRSGRGLKNMMYFIFDRHLDAKKADSINLHRFSVIRTKTDLDFGSKVWTQTETAAPSLTTWDYYRRGLTSLKPQLGLTHAENNFHLARP